MLGWYEKEWLSVSVAQSEKVKREKSVWSINTHIWNLENCNCGAGTETQMVEGPHGHGLHGGKERVGRTERLELTYYSEESESVSRSVETPWTVARQAPPSMEFSR